MSENHTPEESEQPTPTPRATDAVRPRTPAAGAAPAKIKLRGHADGSDPEPMRAAGRMPSMLTEPTGAATPGAATPGAAAPSADTAGAVTPVVATSRAAASRAAKSAPVVAESEQEPAGTTMLEIRPPQEEVERRLAARELAANTKPVLPRVLQVLLAICYPIVLLVLAIRLVATSVFLWIEYHRPGFPADSFGFSTDDRITYGSYTIDYLLNFTGPRYLGDLVGDNGDPLFLAREVGHMADVKAVITLALMVGLLLGIAMFICLVYLSRRSVGGARRGLFAGSIATLVIIIALGVLAILGWETFFTEFHKIFFADGSWTFYTDDTLIRLFPGQFWMDSGIFIGGFVLIVSSLTMALTWPTRSRREAVARSKRPGRRQAA